MFNYSKINKMEIFNKKLIDIITIHDNDSQLKFLKIYPVFKQNVKIVSIWLDIYTEIMYCIDTQIINLSELQTKKKNTINFMVIALQYNLIEYKIPEILELLDVMKNMGDDEKNMKLIKTHTLDTRAQIFIKRNQSYGLIKQPMQTIKTINNSGPNIKTILDFSAKDIASELTFQVAQIVKKVSYRDIIYNSQIENYVIDTKNMSRNNLESPSSPSENDSEPLIFHNKLDSPIFKLINNFQDLCFIVANIILLEDMDISKRINIIKHLLKICDALKGLHNYHSLFAILYGLNNSAIQTIPELWPPKSSYTQHFINMSQLILPFNNYKNYREIIRKEGKSIIIPYIAITIFDIKHLLEYSLYDFDNNDVNLYICEKLLEILENFKSLRSDYKLTSNKQVFEWLSSINICRDNDYLFSISLKIKNNLQKQSVLSVDESHLEEPINLSKSIKKSISKSISKKFTVLNTSKKSNKNNDIDNDVDNVVSNDVGNHVI
jgi:hypothetical protein